MKIENHSKRQLTKNSLVIGMCYRGATSGLLYLKTENGYLVNLEDGVTTDLAAISPRAMFEEVNAKVVVDE